MPAWRDALATNKWAQVGNTLESINPENRADLNPWYGQSGHPTPAPWNGVSTWYSIIAAWSGGAWDETNKRLIITGGGHTNDASNAVVGLDCAATSPTFSLLRPPTGAIGNEGVLDDGLESTCVYFDGRPRSSHTYGMLNVLNNKLVAWPIGSMYKSGQPGYKCFTFDLTTNDWTDHGVPTSAAYAETYSGTCYVPPLDEFWHMLRTDRQWWRMSATTYVGAWATSYLNNSSAKQPVYDPVRNLVLVFGSWNEGFRIIDVTNPNAADVITPVVSGSPPVQTCTEGRGGEGWAYNSVHDLFASLNNYDTAGAGQGTSISVLVPPTSNPLTNAWTWGVIDADSSNTVVPTSQLGTNGLYGRWFFSPSLMGYGVVTDVDTGMYFFPITATYPTIRPLSGSAPNRISIGSTYFNTFQEAANAAGTSTVTVIAEPGLYYEAFKFSGSVTIQSSVPGSRIKIDALNVLMTPSGEGTVVLYGADNTLTDFEITRSPYNSDEGRGIFLYNGSLTLNNPWIHDNGAHGIQGCGDPAVDYSAVNVVMNGGTFERNGGGSGQTHSMYFGRINSLTLNGTNSHDCNVGHQVKARASKITIDGGSFNQGRSSRFLDASLGGEVEVKNTIQCRSSVTGNNTDVVGYALEQSTPYWPINTVNFRASNQIYDATGDMTVVHHDPFWTPTTLNVESYTVLSSCPSYIPPPSPTILTNSLVSGLSGTAYSQSLSASGGTPSYAWSLNSGSLPPGISIDSSGAISGTPSATGTYYFSVRVVDSVAASAVKFLSIIVYGAAASASSVLMHLRRRST